jgi:hypothetical protein
MAAASVYRPTDHVITNVNDPSVVPNFHSKKPVVYKGTGFGRVPDASDYILSQSATSLGADVFSQAKIVLGGNTCLASPPASQVVGQSGNSDGKTNGLNLGYIGSCPSGKFTPGRNMATPVFRPLTATCFVDTLPAIQNNLIGVQSKASFSGKPNTQSGSQNPIICKTTNTSGNWQPKHEVKTNLHSLGPIKTDFLTGVLGPQVSQNGSNGRAPKVGSALSKPKYVEKHHGRAWGPKPFPSAFVPPTGAPAQLKINSPMHYHS